MASHGMKVFAYLSRSKIFHHNPQPFRSLANYNKELTRQPIASPTTSPDYLLQNLKNAINPQTVLELVGSHHKIMNSKQLIQALRSLFTLQKHGNTDLSTQQIIRHPNFDKLCYHLKTQAGLIELNETIEALKVVSFVGVSSDSTIVQVLLQLLRHNVNDLSLSQLIFLDFLLRQFKSSPLVDGLLIALPIVFEVHLPIKMDRSSPAHLAEYLQYVAKKPVSENCIELIANSLLKYMESGGTVDAKIANSILWSICDMEPDEFFEPLIKKVLDALLMDIDKLEYRELQTTMTKLIYKCSPKFPFYYDEIFIDACANRIVDDDLGLEEAIFTLRRLLRVNHASDNLVNYVARKCHENPELLLRAPALHIFIIATSLVLSEVKPVYWKTLKEVLQDTDCFKNDIKRDLLWIKLAASFCALDIYKLDVLEKALDSSYLEKMFKQNFILDYENLLLVNQAISTFQPNYKHLLPHKSVIENVIAKLKPVLEYPLEASLQKGLGGESYVKTCVTTKLGQHIDHVVVMRKGGFPVSLSKTVQHLEDIEVPFDSHVMLILALGSTHYTVNSKRLKATSALMIRALESQGYAVVPVCLEIWNSLADFERIPYIMQAIRLKSNSHMQAIDAVC